MKLFTKLLFGLFALLAALALVLLVLVTPFLWLDGSAKAAYLKQAQGIDLPWYQAAFLTVRVNDVNLKTEPRNSP